MNFRNLYENSTIKWFQKNWMPLWICMYIAAGIDVVVTAWGILVLHGQEGNPVINAAINGMPPVKQVVFMLVLLVVLCWVVFLVGMRKKASFGFQAYAGIGSLYGIGFHLIGAASWLV